MLPVSLSFHQCHQIYFFIMALQHSTSENRLAVPGEHQEMMHFLTLTFPAGLPWLASRKILNVEELEKEKALNDLP